MLRQLLEHHILANLAFLLVLAIGVFAYQELPREQDPSVNFNWVDIKTYWPGAAAPDVEQRVTEPLEKGIEQVSDIKFVSSVSREGVSSILVRFKDLDDDEFDKRVADLRREIQAKFDVLPAEVKQPEIVEITSSNAFPTATLVVWGQSNRDRLQTIAKEVKDDLERFDAIERVVAPGYTDPELHVNFQPSRLVGLGVSPVDAADSVSAYFNDLAAGQIDIGEQNWLVRLQGTTHDPAELARFPIATAEGELPLSAIADVANARAEPRELVSHDGKPGVLLLVFKKEKANNLDLLEEVSGYVERHNKRFGSTGVGVVVLDDQTAATRNAIGVMERNALIGLVLLVITVGAFLGPRIALVTSIGIPFVLAGTFAVVLLMGQTLNSAVLVGVVISLGMLVDDAVVVAEAIHFHLSRGLEGFQAVREALREVMAPVISAVLTTIAAFLPLIFMPGVIGDFMRIVPLVVSIALVISVLEAFWMLPSHALVLYTGPRRRSGISKIRSRLTAAARRSYAVLLMKVLRRPKASGAAAIGILLLAVGSLGLGVVKVDFFAADYYRLFYVNVNMPIGTSLEKTSEIVGEMEKALRVNLSTEAVRGIVSYAGQQVTDREALTGDEKGQIFVSLPEAAPGSRPIEDIIEQLRPVVEAIPGPRTVSFLQRKTGPPTTKPVSIKVRGSDVHEIRSAASELKKILAAVPGVRNIADDDTSGGRELSLRLDPDAIVRSGISPTEVLRLLRIFADGEVVASMQYLGEKVVVRVRAAPGPVQDVAEFFSYPVHAGDGGQIALGDLLKYEAKESTVSIRHYDFRRAVTIEADIDKAVTDTLSANRDIESLWENAAPRYPGVSLDFSGELDDIQESLGAMSVLFLVSVFLIFLILATQFQSYMQPLLILATVPMAFVGVIVGLSITGNPLSLVTLYGVVALAGIAANDAIVLMSTANRLVRRGVPVAMSAVLAARRRLMPIVITTLTTIAGLFSLAMGLAGESLMWGPLATAIIWGLGISSLLTLFLIPLLYALTVNAPKIAPLGWESFSGVWGTTKRRGYGFAWIWGYLSERAKGKEHEFASDIPNVELRTRFQNGLQALNSRDFDKAIRIFEGLARQMPKNFAANLFAARANIALMGKIGWDVGYYERATRYLGRAESIRPEDDEVYALESALRKLEETV